MSPREAAPNRRPLQPAQDIPHRDEGHSQQPLTATAPNSADYADTAALQEVTTPTQQGPPAPRSA